MSKARHNNPFNLEGRLAVVTGACGKLGPVWMQALLSRGATVAGIDLPGVPPGDDCRNLMDRYGDKKVAFFEADILDRGALQQLHRDMEAGYGPCRILVNNAGIDQPPGRVRSFTVWDYDLRQFSDVMAVNVCAAMQVTQVFSRSMNGAGGSIINIGSLYAHVSPDPRLYDHIEVQPPFIKPPAYGASKAALLNLTRYLAVHLAPAGIRVNSLSPGGVLGGQDEIFMEKYRAKVPMGRMATGEDLSGPLIFLASDASAYMTGQDLCIDGGFTAW